MNAVDVNQPAPRADDRLDGWLLSRPDQREGATAVVDSLPDGSLAARSYGELRGTVTRWATQLDELRLEIGSRVIVEAHNGAAPVALLLACSRAGLTYVPVSPEAPAARVQAIVEAAEPAVYLQAEDTIRPIEVPDKVGTGRFDWTAGISWDRLPVAAPRRRRTPTATDPAYIIFTSGTTGTPKGVVMSHRGVLAFYRAMLAERIVAPADRVASTSPLQFDLSLLDIGLALGSGAALVPVPRQLLRWPRRFVAFLEQAEVTQVDGVPSIWRQTLRHEQRRLRALSRIRGVLFSGEEFPIAELRMLQATLPGVRVTNCYGPTECMAISLTAVENPLPDTVDRLSIGQAHQGAEMLLIGEDATLITSPGVVGEIHVRTPALFSGYWNDPEGSRRAIVADPIEPRSGQLVLRTGDLGCLGADGAMYYRGRADSMVKVRGNRIELAEIEQRLSEVPGASSARVLVDTDADGDSQLYAFVAAEVGDREEFTEQLRSHCVRLLPSYMVPARIEVLDAMPTTANGKVDRAVLSASIG
jgi:amino acid adenylation domain-containing protein